MGENENRLKLIKIRPVTIFQRVLHNSCKNLEFIIMISFKAV